MRLRVPDEQQEQDGAPTQLVPVLAGGAADPHQLSRPPTKTGVPGQPAPQEGRFVDVDPEKPILILDDDAVSCQLMAEILGGHGYDAEWTISPSEALQRVSRGEYGLIVSDVVMPEISGTVLAMQIRRLQPGLPILLVTAFPDAMTEDEACDLDIPLLAKPFVPDVLIQRVQDLLSNHPPVESDKSKS